MRRDSVAVDAFAFFGEPFDEAGGVHDLAFGFGQWFALFAGHDQCEVIGIGDHQVEPFFQYGCALFRGFFAPCGPCGIGIGDGFGCFGLTEFRHMADDFAGGRIGHFGGVRAGYPFAVEVALLFE